MFVFCMRTFAGSGFKVGREATFTHSIFSSRRPSGKVGYRQHSKQRDASAAGKGIHEGIWVLLGRQHPCALVYPSHKQMEKGARSEANVRVSGAVIICLLLSWTLACPSASTHVASTWNRETAAQYLDYRETWWTHWMTASLDRVTFCVSCHTNAPHVLARPALSTALHEQGPTPAEEKLVEDVKTRV